MWAHHSVFNVRPSLYLTFECFFFLQGFSYFHFYSPIFAWTTKLSWQSLPRKLFQGNHRNLYFLVFQMQQECFKSSSYQSHKTFFYTTGAKTYTYMKLYINIFLQREAGCIQNNCYTPSKSTDHPERRTKELRRTWDALGAQMAVTKSMHAPIIYWTTSEMHSPIFTLQPL